MVNNLPKFIPNGSYSNVREFKETFPRKIKPEFIPTKWYQELDSNQPHPVLQTGALPDELSWHNGTS